MTISVRLSDPPEVLNLLGNTIRWQLLQALAFTDLRVQELVDLLEQPQNLVSYHLQKLLRSGLLSEQQSRADGRKIYYSLNLDQARTLYFSAGNSLHPALSENPTQLDNILPQKSPPRVLFLCSHNSARSQLAEGILRKCSNDRVEVYSAGTEPSTIHPLTIRALQ
jgi:DNA-binding MarR family transcriptional regulator